MTIADDVEKIAIVVDALTPVFRAIVDAMGGADRARAVLDAEYGAVDAAADLLEDKKFGPP